MFHFPEAPPVDYILSDVRPSHLSDGIFFHGIKPGPTHKCIAKQLTPVKRKPNDPVPPIAKLESRVLERLAVRKKAFYADTRIPGINAWDLHLIHRSFQENEKKCMTRKKNNEPIAMDKQSEAKVIFPCSVRHEYRCTKNKNRKIDDPEKLTSSRGSPVNLNESKFKISSVIKRNNDQPFWWKPKFPEENCLPSIDDSRVNIFEDSRVTKKNYNSDKKMSRWRPFYRITDYPKNEEERTKEMSEIFKPYLHDLDKWYSNNKFNI